MYIVRNLTNKPIVLSDIRAEIGPHKIIDLETIAGREDIERSQDLKDALNMRQLQFVKQTVIRIPTTKAEPPAPRVIEKTVEIHKQIFDEDKLKDIVRSVIKEHLDVTHDSVAKVVASGMHDVIDSIRDKLNSLNIATAQPKYVEVDIDPGKLAELQQKAIETISQDIDTNKIKPGKKIKMIDTKISDLAKEL